MDLRSIPGEICLDVLSFLAIKDVVAVSQVLSSSMIVSGREVKRDAADFLISKFSYSELTGFSLLAVQIFLQSYEG